MDLLRTCTGLLGPRIPTHLREDFTLLTAEHMHGQARLLLAGFIFSLPMCVYGASAGAGPFIAYGLPALIFVLCVTGLVALRTPPDRDKGGEEARRVISLVWKLSLTASVLGGIWCLGSWATAPAETRVYYPAIMSLGALTVGYCLMAARGLGPTVLLITLVPAAIALTTTGDTMDLVLAISMIIAGAFQITMMKRHQGLLLSLVEERHQSAKQARMDFLTGLANRRALIERFLELAKGRRTLRLMVIDIDRFKEINDRHGHDVGDDVLRAFAQLLRIHARGEICAARLGGEEFALLAPVEALDTAIALQLLVEIRGAYMPHGEAVTASIGVAEGSASELADWTVLYGQADRALYRAKNEGRNRAMSSQDGDLTEYDTAREPQARTA